MRYHRHGTSNMVVPETASCSSCMRDVEARPVVVLDTEFPRTVVKHLRSVAENDSALTTLPWLADQIEAQIRPPKPPEPTGLGAVVEDAEGTRWVRYTTVHASPWTAVTIGSEGFRTTVAKFYWQLDAVKVLSEGVTP